MARGKSKIVNRMNFIFFFFLLFSAFLISKIFYIQNFEGTSISLETIKNVEVESTNRMYKISGEIIEIGSRITSFPEKLNVINGVKSYGQEIFVKISENNKFLNGEKVYVYISNGLE